MASSEGFDHDPFSPDDLKKVLEEEASDSTAQGWKFVKKNDQGDEVWRKAEETVPVHLIKAFLNLPGIPPSDVLELITNLQIRKKWEKRFTEIDVLEEHEKYKVVYWRIAMPFGVSDRDIVQYITQRKDDSQDMTYLLYKNATHPEKPEQPGLVRAETILSGTIVRPDKNDPNSSRVTILLQNDIKGWIPAFVVNSFASSAPFEWKQSLSDYYHKEYKK